MSDRPSLDVLVPTCNRPAALAVTLTALAAQTLPALRIVVSDQSDVPVLEASGELRTVVRLLRVRGHEVEVLTHLPRRGMAEQRQFLLDQARAPYALSIDDDVILEPDLAERLLHAITREGCGFVGAGLIGLSYAHDERPHEQAIEWWDGPVEPELVEPGTPAWQRHRLHNAANLLHLRRQYGARFADRLYRVAWVGGCVLYDVAKLRDVGGFRFWPELPAEHCGEDVLAQLRVMARYGGAGLHPSGAYHQELPTTVHDRRVNAPEVLPIEGPLGRPLEAGTLVPTR